MFVWNLDRACVGVGDALYVIGGQEGDFMPKPGSPIFKCSRRHEVGKSSSLVLLVLNKSYQGKTEVLFKLQSN